MVFDASDHSNLSLSVAAPSLRTPVGVVEAHPRRSTRLRTHNKRISDAVWALRCLVYSARAELDDYSGRHFKSGAIEFKKQLKFVHRQSIHRGRWTRARNPP